MIRSGGGSPDHDQRPASTSSTTTRLRRNPGGLRPRPGSRPATPCVRSGQRLTTAMARPAPMVSQRLTNFNRPGYTTPRARTLPSCPPRISVPNIFVSPEDVVWQEATNTNNVYTIGGVAGARGTPSSVAPPARSCPTCNTPSSLGAAHQRLAVHLDDHGPAEQRVQRRRRSTGTSSSSRTGRSLDRSGTTASTRPPARPWSRASSATARRSSPPHGLQPRLRRRRRPDRAASAGTATQPDPVVKVGDLIADVTYERIQNTVTAASCQHQRRCGRAQPAEQRRMGQPAGAAVLLVPGPEGDARPRIDPTHPGGPYRSMVVYVNRKLEAQDAC